MITILAQTDLPSVPAEVFKWTVIILVAVVLIACVIYGAIKSGQRPVQTKIDDDPPLTVRKAPKRYNHDATEQRFVRIETRLDGHDAELDELQKQHNESLIAISRSLGRIEGKLGTGGD